MTQSNEAIVFPGQGSQSVGMLGDLAAQHPVIADVFAQASNVLGYDLWELTQQGPKEKLDQTEYTQPALLAASYATWQMLDAKPKMLAGHSLGEYTALVCANAMSFTDAIKLVAARGQFMQAAVNKGEGAMAAIIGLDNDVVAAICQQAAGGEVLSPANFNSIGQVVIAGSHDAVMRAIDLAKEKGARMAVSIPVSVPSHCALMKPAAEKLAAMLTTIAIDTPTLPVVSNVDVAIYATADSIRDGLVRQLYMPVRWVETIQFFANAGVTKVIECGPGKVLTGLIKRIDKALI